MVYVFPILFSSNVFLFLYSSQAMILGVIAGLIVWGGLFAYFRGQKLNPNKTFQIYVDGIRILKPDSFHNFKDIDRIYLESKRYATTINIIKGEKVFMINSIVPNMNYQKLIRVLEEHGVRVEKNLNFLKEQKSLSKGDNNG